MSITPFFHVYHKYVFNMANINKIKLSGTTYSIQDENATKTVELTQAQYDALSVKDPNTFYIITDATAGDLSNYYTKSETSGATEISTALGNKQDTLVSGTNIKTINNESILGSGNINIEGGGGKSIVGGRGISITTGETVDTVSFNLPISAGTGSDSIIVGYSGNTATKSYSIALGSFNKASGDSSMAVNDYNVAGGNWAFAGGEGTKALGVASTSFGYNTNANKDYSFAVGRYNNANNVASFACGVSNISSSASTTFGHSGNTLFSVGNGGQGYYSNKRHNAFEIRENGDIYIADTNDTETTYEYEKPMIKLQDALGGGGSTYTGVSGITINENNEIYYKNFVRTWLSKNHDDRYAVYWFKGDDAKIWINGNSPEGHMNYLRSQFSFGYNQLNGSIDGFALGANNNINGFNAGGLCNGNTVNGNYSLGVNYQNKTNNSSEFASGQFNKSVSTSTTFGNSGNTLFSVGNGTADNARHNAFEIRQNGDIYLSLNGQDVKLQDALGGGSSYTAGDGIDITNDVISVTGKVDTTAFTAHTADTTVHTTAAEKTSWNGAVTALGGLKLVKLSQSEYDSLATKDNSTLYVIVN